MKINNIEFRNIGSYGNKIHRLDFSDEGILYQISGRSGMGKSTILNLPKLAFYGKIDKVNKNDIANRIDTRLIYETHVLILIRAGVPLGERLAYARGGTNSKRFICFRFSLG